MIQVSQLIEIFQIMQKEKWKYQWGAAREGFVDCSGAFAYAFKKLGGYMYHGSNTMWRKYTTEKGKMGQITLVPGMAVFRWRQNGSEPARYKQDGEGDFYHVGLYVGGGRVIEAKSSKDGVVYSNASGWPMAAKLVGVNYEGQQDDLPADDLTPTLSKGSKGERVQAAQLRLIAHGFNLPLYGADGIFGSETQSAVIGFQKTKGINADGIINQETWQALNKDPSEGPKYIVTIPNLDEETARQLVQAYSGASYQAEYVQENG